MSDEGSSVEKLITEIQKHPWLFDLTRLDYRDLRKKERSWSAISHAVGLTVDECMLKWRNLRDRYARELRSLRRKGGSIGNRTTTPWPLMNRMEFLMSHVKHRRSFYNDISNQTQNDDSEHYTEPEISISGLDSDSKDATHNTTKEEGTFSPKSHLSVDVTQNNNPDNNWISNQQQYEQNVDFPSPCSSTTGCSGIRILNKRSLESPVEELEGTALSCHYLEGRRNLLQDEEHNFGMIVASKLRKLPERVKDEVEIQILQLLLKAAK